MSKKPIYFVAAFFCLLAIMAIVGCFGGGSEGGNPFAANGPVVLGPDPTTAESAKIMLSPTASGKLQLSNGAALHMPAGAVGGEREVTFSLLQDAAPENDAVSAVFQISGLADRISDVTVELPTTQVVAPGPGEETWLLVNEGESNRPSQSRTSSYLSSQLVKADVKDGKIVAVLPANSGFSSSLRPSGMRYQSADAKKTTVFALGYRHSVKSTSNKFYLVVSKDDHSQNFDLIEKIKDSFDKAFSFLENDLGLSFSGGRSPIPVYLFSFKNNVLGGYRGENAWGYAEFPTLFTTSRFYISLNTRKFKDADAQNQFSATIGHELFHLLQRLYLKDNGKHALMQDASSVWLEHQMVTASDFWPAVVDVGYINSLLSDGYLRREDDDHAYAASVFLRYLSSKKGNASVGGIWKSLKEKDSQRKALGDAFVESFWYRSHWFAFVEELFSGKFLGPKYSTVSLAVNSNNNESWRVTDPVNQGSTEFDFALYPLAAKRYYLKFDYEKSVFAANQTAKLVLTTVSTDSTLSPKLLLFKINQTSKNGEKVGEISKDTPLTIDNFHLLDKPVYVVVAVSGHDPTDEIQAVGKFKIEIKIEEPSTYFVYEVLQNSTTGENYARIKKFHPTGSKNDLTLLTDPVVPATLGGYPVRSIDQVAFACDSCPLAQKLTAVTLPSSLNFIGRGAFAGNAITTVSIPDNISVDEEAFEGNNIVNLALGDNVRVYRRAFRNNRLESYNESQITAGNNVSFYDDDPVPTGFVSAYASQGAGTYIYKGVWQKQ